MFPFSALSVVSGASRCAPDGGKTLVSRQKTWCQTIWLVLLGMAGWLVTPAGAVILWNDPGASLIHENGPGLDILGGAVKRDDSANDTLYFKFHVDPLSDEATEPYFAALELYEGDNERIGVGNALEAWGYSAFFNSEGMTESNQLGGYIDLHTAKPDVSTGGTPVNYQRPRRGTGATIVFKVQYVPGGDDLVTVWLNPDLGPGANEANQPEILATRFNANASFDEIRLRHGGNGGGWTFSDIAIATAFNDFVDVSSAKPGGGEVDFNHGVPSLHFHSWLKEQGLPQSPARALIQTREGYIWIGSDDGLARFDGLHFTAFGSQEGIKSGPVSALLEDDHGALWIGSTDHGLSCWKDNQVTTLSTRDGLPSDSITAMAEDPAGHLWIGTDAGLMTFQNGQLSPLKSADSFKGRRITALLKDRLGRMWVGVKDAGVFQLLNDEFVRLSGDSMDGPLKDSHCLLLDQTGRLWIGAGEDLVLCCDVNQWRRYRIPRAQAKSHISSLALESDGTVWAGSAGGGLLHFRDGKFYSLPANCGLAGNLIESLLTDSAGRLWVGTDEGLNCLGRKGLFTLSQGEGLGFGAAQGLAEVSPGIVWVGKPNDGLYRWDGRGFNRLFAAGLLPHDSRVTALLVTHNGFCWVATTNSLLLYKDPVAAADEVQAIRSVPKNIISLAEDRDGALWAGTRDGKIWQLREGQWLEPAGFSQSNAVTAIVPQADGAFWIGTDGDGLYRLANGSFRHMDRKDGLFSSAIRTLYLDRQGTLWIGTADAGLSRWREGQVVSYTTRDGLPDNDISQILEDDWGRLWLGTGRGIACIRKSQLEDLTAGKNLAVYPKTFTRADGMLSEECTGGFCPAGLKTKSGLLWFSTAKGVVVVAPQTQPVETPMPNVVLEEILVDGIPVARNSVPASLRIPPGRHRLEIRYTGLRYDSPETIRFRYRLAGWDSDWVDAGTSRTAIYNFVPPGEYQFRVIACNSDGTWSPNSAELALRYQRYFWQSWWFLGLAGAGLLVSVGAAVRLVEKQKNKNRLKRLEQERALEQERTRIARDLHDEMGAKLCRISFLSEHARRANIEATDMQEQITSISDESREVLHSLDEIVWAVNPQNDTLEHVASYLGQYANDYFQMTGIGCELDFPSQLPPRPVSSHVRHHLFLAVREALTNILKHAGASQVKISITCGGSQFEISIEDNGRGFDPANIPSRSNPPGREADPGNGLPNMNRRMADLGGRCQLISSPGKGTTVKFILPFNPTI
jgi:ligand-binding sensor domain-containing protein/signal transduction histidine kinase